MVVPGEASRPPPRSWPPPAATVPAPRRPSPVRSSSAPISRPCRACCNPRCSRASARSAPPRDRPRQRRLRPARCSLRRRSSGPGRRARRTRTPAAPTNGARIILYEVNVSTGTVIEPTTAVGYVDLLDESTTGPAVDKLHVIVKDGTPASPGPTTYADYTISGSITGSPATAFNASAVGFVSDGTHTLSFNASFTATNLDTDNPDAQIDVTWDLDNPVVHVELHEAVATADVDHATITINFSVTRGTETVSVSGTVTLAFLTVTATVNITVQVNGVAYARITGPVSDAQRRHANGSAVSAEEDQALFDLFLLPLDMEIAIESLFTPSEHLMGG